jgi:predicted DNA-binding ribbon-helix-helix protein
MALSADLPVKIEKPFTCSLKSIADRDRVAVSMSLATIRPFNLARRKLPA